MVPSLLLKGEPSRNQVTSGFGIPETTGPGEGREAPESTLDLWGAGRGGEAEPEGRAQSRVQPPSRLNPLSYPSTPHPTSQDGGRVLGEEGYKVIS